MLAMHLSQLKHGVGNMCITSVLAFPHGKFFALFVNLLIAILVVLFHKQILVFQTLNHLYIPVGY